jgi:hypothetical protein
VPNDRSRLLSGRSKRRDVDLIVAVTFTSEIGDMRRFDGPCQLMTYTNPQNERPASAQSRRAMDMIFQG